MFHFGHSMARDVKLCLPSLSHQRQGSSNRFSLSYLLLRGQIFIINPSPGMGLLEKEHLHSLCYRQAPRKSLHQRFQESPGTKPKRTK
jgi:hypothetical protein